MPRPDPDPASAEPERVSTGSVGLDDILPGGLDADRVYLLEGRPGTGKTTLALQFLLEGVRSGEGCLYVTLSESERELRGVAARHGWSLDGIDVFELIPPEASLDPEQELTLFHPAEMELSETTKHILDRVAEFNPKRVVFDSLSEMRLLAQSPLRYRRQILALKNFFAGRRCTVMLLDDFVVKRPRSPAAQHRASRRHAGAARARIRCRAAPAAGRQDARHEVPRWLSRFYA